MESILEKYGVIPLSAVKADHVRDLIPEMIYFGRPNIFIGDSACGKTALLCSLASVITNGSIINGHEVTETGEVLLLSVDDGAGITVSVLRANGATAHVHVLDKGASVDVAKGLITAESVDKVLAAIGNVKALMIDSVKNFIFPGEVTDWKERKESVKRQILALQEVCDKHNCALIITAHGEPDRNKSYITSARDFDEYGLSMMDDASVYSIHTINRNKSNFGIKKTRYGNLQDGFFARYTIGNGRKITWI